MATYADEKNTAEVGDVVECRVDVPGVECATLATVEKVAGNGWIQVSGTRTHVHPGNFKLISRAPSPPHEPLVKWPEEVAKLTWPQLHDNTAFVFDMVGCRDVPHLRVVGGYASFRTNEIGAMDVHSGNKSYPVRLLKITRPPSCEVI